MYIVGVYYGYFVEGGLPVPSMRQDLDLRTGSLQLRYENGRRSDEKFLVGEGRESGGRSL